MRTMLFLLTCLSAMYRLEAQTVANVQKLIDYERYDSAGSLVESILKADPNNAEAWWLLSDLRTHCIAATATPAGATGSVIAITNQLNAVKDSLSHQVTASSNSPLVLCGYANILLREGQKDSASMWLTKAIELSKEKDPTVLLAAATAQVENQAGDPAIALDWLGKAVKRDKHDPRLYVAMGNAYRRMQNGTESYKAYQSAIDQDSHNAPALFKMGKLFLAQENKEMYVKYFTDAVTADPQFSPAWYELYYFNYFRDVNKAMDCLQHYVAASDKSIHNDYLMTDLLYASRKYKDAVDLAKKLIGEGAAGGSRNAAAKGIAPSGGNADALTNGKTADTREPRLYKLIAYSYKELGDSLAALNYMRQYFREQVDTGFVVRDYEAMGDIYDKWPGKQDSAAACYARAADMEKDSAARVGYYHKLGGIYKQLKDYRNQALWLGKYYQGNSRANNLDLFNWGLASYMGGDYHMADSVFGLYETKYPDQNFGYYWRARSDAAIDTAMTAGIAVPHYLKFIGLTKDTVNATNRRHLIESYGYIAAYKANTEKDLQGAIDYFEKLLTLDPGNGDARKYITILKKNLSKAGKEQASKTTPKDNGKEPSKT